MTDTQEQAPKPKLRHMLAYWIVMASPMRLLSYAWFQDAFLPAAGLYAYYEEDATQ